MQTAAAFVKIKSALICVIVGLFLAGCATETPPSLEVHLNPKETIAMPFESHSNYLQQTLKYEPFERIRLRLEEEIGQPLKNRGEAHITVVTPPEWEILIRKVEPAEIDGMARKLDMQQSFYDPVCIGHGRKVEKDADHPLKTFFVVVRDPALIQFRQKLEDLYRERGGTGAFQALHFNPHVTLGFTERDLFESDGVLKDESSCSKKWKIN